MYSCSMENGISNCEGDTAQIDCGFRADASYHDNLIYIDNVSIIYMRVYVDPETIAV